MATVDSTEAVVSATSPSSSVTSTSSAEIATTTLAPRKVANGVVAGCGWFDSQPEAQEWFEENRDFGEGVDTNGDGSACDVGDWGGLGTHCTVPVLGHQNCEAFGGVDKNTSGPGSGAPSNGVVAGCGSFDSQRQAQEWFEENRDFGEGVDTNGDGSACDFGDWGGLTRYCIEPVLAHQIHNCEAFGTISWQQYFASFDFSNGALPNVYPLPTGELVNVDLLAAPNESDENLCRIPQLPGSRYGGEGATAFPVVFGNLKPDQNVRLATIPVDWFDHQGNPADLSTENRQVQIFMDYYEMASNGALTFTPTFAEQWYRLPESVSSYPQRQVSDFNPKLAQHGINAADDDLDFSQVDMVVFIFPTDAPIPAGVPLSPTEHASMQAFNDTDPADERYVASDEGWIRNYISGGMYFDDPLRPVWSYYIHEAAHMFEMPDWYLIAANAVLGSQTPPELNLDYAAGPLNVWGVMSSQDGPSRTFVAWTRWLLGWLDDDQVDCYSLEQVQTHGSFDTELLALDIYESGTKAIIIRTGQYSGLLIESRRPVFPDDWLVAWETNGRDPYGLIVYEIDATLPGAYGTLSVVTPDGHEFGYMERGSRMHQKVIDALFNVGNSATVQGIGIELIFSGNRDVVRISAARN